MVVCVTCGAEDFFQQEGFFFCSVCQTQSQQVREEGLEQFYEDPIADAISGGQMKISKGQDKGRIWLLEEGFTVILKKQVECLIKRGAKPELKDKVFKLWVHYLRTNKVAFCKDAKWLQNKHGRNFRAGVKRKRKELRTIKSKKQLKKIKTPEFVDSEDDDSYDRDGEDSSEDEFCLDLADYGERDSMSPTWMMVRKTPVFLYLGLLYSGHNVTLADLIRWAADDVYPLNDTSSCLNPDMKFIEKGGATSLVFRVKSAPPTMEVLRRQCKVICSHLGLDNIPPPDMKQLVSTYIVRLALPGELHSSTRFLMKEVPTVFKPTHHPPPFDAIALAYIIITLKFLLGLDDFRERQLSSFARELTKKLPLRQKLFIWDEWVQMHEKRRKRLQQHCPKNLHDACEITNIGEFVEKRKEEHSLKKEKEFIFHKVQRPEMQRQMARPLESLLSEMPDPQGGATADFEDSEPLFSETFDMADFGESTSQQKSAVKTVKPVLTEEEKVFSSTTLRYISEGVDFLQHLGNHGITDGTLSSIHDLDQEESPETRQVITRIRQAILLGLRTDREVVDPDDPLTQLSHRLSLKKDCYMIYNYGNNKWHSSYQWLLNLMGEVACMEPTHINNQVRIIELLLFKVSPKTNKGLVQIGGHCRFGEHFDTQQLQKKVKELEGVAVEANAGKED